MRIFLFPFGEPVAVITIDPHDADPIRYAILASMAEALVAAFNWRLELGLQRDKSIDEPERRARNYKGRSSGSAASYSKFNSYKSREHLM
jgi:hypothetical protein